MTTAAQNMHGLLRKSLLFKEHFFGWLKTENFSNACGTVTLKSPPPQAFSESDVHQRLRKRPPRCTLDCGFKTSESPALRGFVGGLRALATAALYLVLKSNGLHHSKNPPVKFDFSSKSVPTNIAKKLPSQRCFKPFLISFFNFSHKWPTFAFTSESKYTLGSAQRIAHKGLHGETGGVSDGGWYHSPRSIPHVHEHPRAGCQNGVLCRFWVLVVGAPKERREPRDSDALMRVAVPRRRGPAGLRDLFRFCRNCGLYALRSGPFRVCEAKGGITTLGALCVLLKRRTAACQNDLFAVF